MSHPTITPRLDPSAQATLHAELSKLSQDPALRPWLQRPSSDLGPRFARYLTRLPRRMRRQLQRQ